MADELHKFLFDGLPVRGVLVRLSDTWVEILRRRQANPETGPWPPAVAELLGEMVAAAALMQANIKFNGALILQIFGDGPVKLAVAEVQPDLSLRATAKVVGAVGDDDRLPELVNRQSGGRCAVTLDPRERQPGQQPYQGVVPLSDAQHRPFTRLSDVLMHFMQQSEQLESTLVLAADAQVAAGLLIQRLPLEGERNLGAAATLEDAQAQDDAYGRIALLASSLQRQELLELDVDTVLRRLFWQEKVLRFPVQAPRFACTCSRQRVAGMIRGLGAEEAHSILAERSAIDVGCDFCGQHYAFDAVDAARLFTDPGDQPPVSSTVQ